eukprot:scaffold8605_cov178-Amphora_coffeaeformis.AAC.15
MKPLLWFVLYYYYYSYVSLLVVGAATNYIHQHDQHDDHDHSDVVEGMISWVRSHGGFFSEKLEMRRYDPNNAQSPYGMFATQDIASKETLFKLPHECIMFAQGLADEDQHDHDEADEDEEEREEEETYCGYDEEHFEDMCPLAKTLIQEMRLGDKSKYAPYVNYLLTQKYGQIPATYSEPGKMLIQKILGKVLPPKFATNSIKTMFHKSGCISPDDPLEEQAVALMMQRGYDVLLIPIFDMLNHHNGKFNTESNSAGKDGYHNVRASKPIRAGEEVYNSYDQCADCGPTVKFWGTPEIFRDFGFVESYPQRFHFHEQEISFRVDEVYDTHGESQLKVTWLTDMQDDEEGGIFFLQQQVQRLVQVAKEEFGLARQTVPQNELETIMEFHRALTVAMSIALKDAMDNDLRDSCNDAGGTCSSTLRDRYHNLKDEIEKL